MVLRDVSVLLLYPPNQNLPGTVCKPNGSLAYPHLGGALRHHGVPVRVFDACVGDDGDPLHEIFANPSALPSGLLRTGVDDERILEVVAEHDIVGITSIFTDQESMVLHCARLIKAAYPDKILVSGGVNARSRLPRFFEAGFDVVCLSEAEHTLVEIVEIVRRSTRPDFGDVHGVAFPDGDRIRVNPTRSRDMVRDLDTLPMPAWDLLPNQRYWDLGRPHSGVFEPGAELRYGTMMTSLGCPFHCAYCHIAGEGEGSLSGPVGTFRVKSDERVLAEIETLKSLGVTDVFIEDDSLLGDKKRGLRLLEKIQGAGVTVCDLNGINLIHLLKRWKPDHEVLEALAMAGFTQINMPFETGNLRIMRKYASNKLNVDKADLTGLITAMKDYGFKLYGNYMIGYPDETFDEVESTIALAREHMSYGLDAANFFLVVPMPGSPLFDMAIANGHLSPDFDPDKMNIYNATMTNTTVPGEVLEATRAAAWEEVNSSTWKNAKKAWAATAG
ncbi:B12-binding domain-containing radical SAM protein [Saccharomonospora iraqiensis]|uniref:B12-binding domain-containing radical SAM protein n=1 Tax=Saccharomonospora iraqiensis TaxID=52698 RepID=UPI00022E6E59|nr:radical SAM protein [Saccharomonospora iraqiensis]